MMMPFFMKNEVDLFSENGSNWRRIQLAHLQRCTVYRQRQLSRNPCQLRSIVILPLAASSSPWLLSFIGFVHKI